MMFKIHDKRDNEMTKGMNLVLVFFFSLLLQAEDRIQIKATWAGLKDAHLSGLLDDQIGPVGNPYNLVIFLQWENGEKVTASEFNSRSEEFWYLPKSAKVDGKAAREFLLLASGSVAPAARPVAVVPAPAQTVPAAETIALKSKVQQQNETITSQESQLSDAAKRLAETRTELEATRSELSATKARVSELEAKVASATDSNSNANTQELMNKIESLSEENADLRRQLDAVKAAAENGNADVEAEKIRNGLIIALIIFSLACAVYYLTSLPKRLAKILKKTPKTAAIKKALKAPAPSKEVSIRQPINLDDAVKQIVMGTVAKAFLEMKDGDGGSIEVSVATPHAQDALVDALKEHLGQGYAVAKLRNTGHRGRGTATYHVGIVPLPAASKVLAINQA